MVEEIKLLIPLLQQAGEAAWWIAIILCAKEFFLPIILGAMIIIPAYKLLVFGIKSGNETYGLEKRCAIALGLESYSDGDIKPSDRDKIIECLKKHFKSEQ